MDKTDEEILKSDPELAQLFTDDEDEADDATSFNFGRSRDSRRSQSAKLGYVRYQSQHKCSTVSQPVQKC